MFLGLIFLGLCANAYAHLTAQQVAELSNGYVIPDSTQRSIKSLVRDEAPAKCEEGKVKCEKNKLVYCDGSGETIEQPCQSGYVCDCDGKKCVSQVTSNCLTSTSCKTDGEKKPIASDCKAFTYCETDKLRTIVCNNGLIYDPNQEKCVYPAVCRTLTCPKLAANAPPKLIPFPQAPQYYLFCAAQTSYVAKCATKNFTVDATANECVFRCTKSGQFKSPDKDECEKGVYYSCVGSGTSFRKQKLTCEEGMKFDEEKDFCTKEATCEEPEETPPDEDDNTNDQRKR